MAEALSIIGLVASTVSLVRRIENELKEQQNVAIQYRDFQDEVQGIANQLEQLQRLTESTTISNDETKAMERDLSTLEKEKLIAVANDLRDYVRKYQALWFKARNGQGQLPVNNDNAFDVEIQRIKKENRKLSDLSEKQNRYIRELHRPRWIMAEDDYPNDEPTFNCFSDPVPTVLVYDPFASCDKLKVASQNEMKNKAAIVAKLPSHRAKNLYVFVEPSTSTGESLVFRVRVATKNRPVDGLQLNRTVPLGRLPVGAKIKIMTGRIHWLFILHPYADSDSAQDLKMTTDSSVY